MTNTAESLPHRLRQALGEDRQRLIEFLEQVVRAESPTDDNTAIARVQDLLAGAFAGIGYRVRRVCGRERGGVLLAYPGNRRRDAPLQLLLGHCDTVWPLGTLRTMPVRVRSGRMMGPGVYDMKGGLVQMLAALRALSAIGEEPAVTPVVLINSDEETGSEESTVAVARLARLADRVLVLEPAMGPAGKLKTARKGVGHFTVDVQGRAAHAGLEPGKGVSAILEAARVVEAISALDGLEEGISVNVGRIVGGLRANVVPPFCRAEVDVRVMTMAQAARIEQELFRIAPTTPGTRLEIRGGISSPPLERTPRNRALWQLARETGARLGLQLEECLVGGGSDGNTASQYAPTLDGLGPIGDGAHADHEYIELDSLIERAALLGLLLCAPTLAKSGEIDVERSHSAEPLTAVS